MKESQTKYIPGPWKYSVELPYGRDIHAGDIWVGDAKGPHNGGNFPTSDQCLAHARLMTAAPYLFEALKEAIATAKAAAMLPIVYEKWEEIVAKMEDKD